MKTVTLRPEKRSKAHGRPRSSRSRPGISRLTCSFVPRKWYLLALVLACHSLGKAQESADFFRQNCTSCHTIGGGRLTGPDLKNVTQRKDRAWLVRYLIDPKEMIDSGDPYAVNLLKENRGVVMPTIAGMTKQRAEALLDLIEAESKLDKSHFIGLQLSERPFTPQDVDVGRSIFTGALPLKNGGPACISCHTVRGIGELGGGTLAPDLTTVFERYSGRRTLSTWLSAPLTPTMQANFSNKPLDSDEVLALVAFFQKTLQRTPEDVSTLRLTFVLLGMGGALLMLGFFDVIWMRRFRGVRRQLVRAKQSEMNYEH